MKQLKSFLLILAFASVNFSLRAQSDSIRHEGGLTWYTNVMQANEVSHASNKPIFAFFTGSDWCGWCRKMQKDVFAKPEFVKWANDNVILVELDFPQRKVLSPELTAQNASLQQTFQVQGFPTVWLFFLNKNNESQKFDIEALGSLGYPTDATQGKEQLAFLSNANTILAKKTAK